MEQLLIISHVFCGATVLLLGLIQMINRKGGSNHKIIGRIYVGAMWWICLSAWSIILFYRFSTFLMVIAVLTFYASFTGVRVLRRKEVGSEKWYDRVVALITGLFGIGLMVYGGYLAFYTNNQILGILCSVFGFFMSHSGFQDLRFFIRKSSVDKSWWLKQHIEAMGGSYIAAITAFAVQNPNIFLPGSSYQWLLWILPAAIGSPLISIMSKKWMGKSNGLLAKGNEHINEGAK
ncbi:hypothetical protein [Ekhidna sp.]|jgi:uncharacterized membrane protein|uniref:hypothetical protein n=1 Tax=Ekhidna sp. TaxID=2608089 RepID=UPI0032EB9A83